MANVGYVLIEHFAVAVERRHRPELLGHPVIVGGYPHERKTVYDASAEAAAMGAKPGLALRQAQQLCPTAVFLPLVADRYRDAADALLATVESFSPAVEPAAPGGAYFDARGLQRLFGADDELAHRLAAAVQRRSGLTPCVGLGPTRFTARVAAQLSQPGAPLVVSNAPAEFLSALPVEYLTGEDDRGLPGGEAACRSSGDVAAFCDRLRLLGIRTIGQFMRLPFPELMEQLGPAGVAAYNLAHGRADAPILPRQQPAALQRAQQFEPPIGDAAAFVHAVDRLSAALGSALQRRYQACQTVILRFELECGNASFEQTAQLKAPTAQSAAIAAAALRLGQRIFREREALAEDGALPGDIDSAPQIAAIQIVVTGLVAQGGSQLGLFDAQRQRRTHLRQATGEVYRRFGNRLKRAERTPASDGIAAPPFVLRDYLDCP